MKKILCTLVAVIAVALTVVLAGCSGGDKNFEGEWQSIAITEFCNGESYSYPVSAETGTTTLIVSKDGTFKINASYDGEVIEGWISGKWSQEGDVVTLSDVICTDTGDEPVADNRYTVTFIDSDTLNFKIEVEIYSEIEEGTTWKFKRK